MCLSLDKKKSFKILLISGILIILGVFVIFNYSQILKWWEENFITAQASIDAKVRGWAWGENMGWISMNCYNDFDYNHTFENCCPGGDAENCTSAKICQGGSKKGQACSIDDDCPDSTCSGLAGGDYGVYYDKSNKKLRGYAWSDKVGWICFGETCGSTTTPHGWPSAWACVGGPRWVCSNDDSQICSNDNECAGDCIFGCSGDGEEDFLDITTQGAPCYSMERKTLKAHWKMNAINAVDSSNQIPVNNGTLMPVDNPPILANGKFENALQFDGENDYILVADSDSLSVDGNLTVEAWIKRAGRCVGGTNEDATCFHNSTCSGGGVCTLVNSEQTIIGKWDEDVEGKSYRLWFGADNKLNFSVADNSSEATITQTQGLCFGGSNEGSLCSTDSMCEGVGAFCRNPLITDTMKWHHVAGKYTAAIGTNAASLRLFIDGLRVNVGSIGATPVSLSDKNNDLYIGAKKGVSGMDTYFNGIIDNVSIWSCDGNASFVSGRSAKDIWNDAKMEISGWAKIVALGDGGWLKLQGFTKAGKVWGLYLNDYDTFYTIGGYMANRHADTSMDTTGLVANWLMDEASWVSSAGPIPVEDSSPSGNNSGTANGAVPNVQGIFNSAGEFDGEDDYIDCGSNESLEDTTATIQAWIKRGSTNTHDVILSDNKTSVANEDHFLRFEIIEGGSNDDKLAIIFGDGTDEVAKYSTGTINDTNWHHVVVVRDHIDTVGGTITFYIDGEAEASQPYNLSNAMVSLGSDDLWIGKSNVVDYYGPFHGLIDNLAIYNIARTAEQILEDYNKQNPYCVGWGDYDHQYSDLPAPLAFDNLSIDNNQSCTQLFIKWEASDWAENYTYWRCDGVEENDCDACSYTEYNVLDADEFNVQDTNVVTNTGYCYKVQAHNETGSTWSYDSPLWAKTTLCSPVNIKIDDDTCGEIKLSWNVLADADGYNIYRSLSNDSNGCNYGLTASNCELMGHLGEGMDYTGLKAQWKMNESSWNEVDGEVKDSSNQTPANNGIARNGLSTTSDGKFSYAGNFIEGIDGYIDCGSSNNLEVPTVTVQAWIKRGSTNAQDVIIADNDPSEFSKDHHLWFEVGSDDRLAIIFGDGTDGVTKYSTGTINDTDWHHVAVVRNDTTKTIAFYIDGEAETEQSYFDKLNTICSGGDNPGALCDGDVDCTGDGTCVGAIVLLGSDDLWIGKSNVVDHYGPFYGLIDNLAIYNIARTAEQIKFDYDAGNCGHNNCGLGGECHIKGEDTNCGYALEDESNCANCPNYVCHIQGNPDSNCGSTAAEDDSICCYTDKRVLPYVSYYYRTTATSEAGESPASDCHETGDDCPAIGDDPCCPNGRTICFPPMETKEE